MRPVLIPGNSVAAALTSRTDAQLPQASLELVHSRAPMLGEALPLAAVDWATALVAAALPERQPYPRLYDAFAGFLDAVEAAQSASGWGGALARFELLMVAELGYGEPDVRLPRLAGSPRPEWSAILSALEMSGRTLFGEILGGRTRSLEDSRERLLGRLRRMAG